MQLGVFYFPTDYGIDIAELALALETRGFASLYLPEHTHIPVSRRSPFPAAASCQRSTPTPMTHSWPCPSRRNIQRVLDNYAPLAAAE